MVSALTKAVADTRDVPSTNSSTGREEGPAKTIVENLSVADYLNEKPGAMIKCPLPGHDDWEPSFKVYSGGFKCYGCGGKGGSVIDLAMQMHGLDVAGAIRRLAPRAGVELAKVPPVTLVSAPDSSTTGSIAAAVIVDRAVDGSTFVLEEPDVTPALWGSGELIAAAQGEPTMIFGPTGVGKTTVCQQFVLARIGVRPPSLLGMDVTLSTGKVLYLACDRPRQAARSLKRMVDAADADLLRDRLTVWRGPLPFNVVTEPARLAVMAKHYGADLVVVDSLKDIVPKLNDDEAGLQISSAFQELVAEGIDVIALHHSRKATGDNRMPNKVEDVYGSTWLTAGMGSVICVWGAPGDAVVIIKHLKQPAEDFGPLKVIHDHTAGTTTVLDGVDLVQMACQSHGITAKQAAAAMFDKPTPTRNQVEKARRRLHSLVSRGLLVERPGTTPEAGGKPASTWHGASLLELP